LKNNKISVSAAEAANEDTKNSSYSLVSEGAFFTPMLNNNGDKVLYSSGDDIYEYDLSKQDIKQLTTMGNCYNPVYNIKDNNIVAFARNDGIYEMDLKRNSVKKIVDSKDPQVSFAKPSFTSEGDLIYFKVTVLPRPEGHGFTERNPAIYKLSKKGRNEEKLLEGYNPVLSRNGKSLVYEWKGNIYLMNLETKEKKLVDSGKYAALSNDGKYISYAKYDRDIVPYGKTKGYDKLYIDKEFSNIYVIDANNTQNKFKLTSEEFDNKDIEIESWAKEVKYKGVEQHFLVVSKISYFDTMWSKDDNFIYISAYNTDKGDFELLKINFTKR
jgi:hypothetical protein